MTSDRPYRRAGAHERAVAELRRCSGSAARPGGRRGAPRRAGRRRHGRRRRPARRLGLPGASASVGEHPGPRGAGFRYCAPVRAPRRSAHVQTTPRRGAAQLSARRHRPQRQRDIRRQRQAGRRLGAVRQDRPARGQGPASGGVRPAGARPAARRLDRELRLGRCRRILSRRLGRHGLRRRVRRAAVGVRGWRVRHAGVRAAVARRHGRRHHRRARGGRRRGAGGLGRPPAVRLPRRGLRCGPLPARLDGRPRRRRRRLLDRGRRGPGLRRHLRWTAPGLRHARLRRRDLPAALRRPGPRSPGGLADRRRRGRVRRLRRRHPVRLLRPRLRRGELRADLDGAARRPGLPGRADACRRHPVRDHPPRPGRPGRAAPRGLRRRRLRRPDLRAALAGRHRRARDRARRPRSRGTRF